MPNFLTSCKSVNVCLTPLYMNNTLLGLQFLDNNFSLQKLTYTVLFSFFLYFNVAIKKHEDSLISLLSKFFLVSSSQMPKKFSELIFLMFSNLQGLVFVVLIPSQISYLECSFDYVDSVLPSFKEHFFFLLHL